MHLGSLGSASCVLGPEFPQGSAWGVAAVPYDCDILCLLIWQEISYLIASLYKEPLELIKLIEDETGSFLQAA